MSKLLATTVLSVLPFILAIAQSRSSYDASFFKTEDQQAAIEIGKGFNITDPFSPTRNCFTSASRDLSLIKRQQQGGAKTNVNVYYTKDDYEYSKFNSNHYSASASFTNIFSVNTSILEEMTSVTSKRVERLIFIATIDFGNYFYQDDPIFTPDAQQLISDGNYELFKSRYGSHYVSGYGKSSSIKVILTKKMAEDEIDRNITLGVDANLNYKGDSYGLSYSNRDHTNKKFSSSGFEVEIELEGPKINTQNLQKLIEQTQTSSDLISSVTDLLINALNDLNDESNAWISRYFFTDFTLYGCGGIIWNIEKEHKLSSINGNYLDAIRISKLADEHLTKGSMQVIFDNYMSKDGLSQKEGGKLFMALLILLQDGNEENRKILGEYIAQFDAINPEWQKLKTKAQNLLPKLKMQYYNCSNLNCDVNGTCCNNTDYTSDLNQLYDIYNNLNSKANTIFSTMANDLTTRVTEQENAKKVKFIIKNRSSHPYKLEYKMPNGIVVTTQTIPAHGQYEISEDDAGIYEFKTTQKSGYLLYPTVEKKSIKIEAGQTKTVIIGFDHN
ncbi:MAG: hypothetical protein J5767_02050 [Paludibacteraceae bacterium]|nr:hypothetical protein [Paludibacteraceae bacterium]